jgi:protein tyrosine phosphatase (PTP) superfamily phosphohydrolase (DUF442 family)
MIEEIYNFVPLNDKMLTGGQPTVDQLEAAALTGVQVVINLATKTSYNAIPNEGQIVESLGMEYLHIPVQWDSPKKVVLDYFMDVLDARSDKKVLIHCAANMRVSAFIALYRVVRLGWNRDKAFGEVRRIWNPDNYPAWKRLIQEVLGDQKTPG